jgi:hypothetical protein
VTQASIPLVTRPIGLADLDVVLYELTLAVNASGIGSAAISPPPKLLSGGIQDSLNKFALAVNAVTAPGTVSLLPRAVDPGDLPPLVNTMVRQINAFQGGGGASPIAVLDFINGIYTIGATSYAVTDLLGGAFDAGAITASGMAVLLANTNRPSTIGPFKTLLNTNNYTCVIEFNSKPNYTFQLIWANINSFNNALSVVGATTGATFDEIRIQIYDYLSGGLNAGDIHDITSNNKVAFTIQASGYAASVDGGTVDTESPVSPEAWDVILIGWSDGNDGGPLEGNIRSIAFYDVQDDTALPILSSVA